MGTCFHFLSKGLGKTDDELEAWIIDQAPCMVIHIFGVAFTPLNQIVRISAVHLYLRLFVGTKFCWAMQRRKERVACLHPLIQNLRKSCITRSLFCIWLATYVFWISQSRYNSLQLIQHSGPGKARRWTSWRRYRWISICCRSLTWPPCSWV